MTKRRTLTLPRSVPSALGVVSVELKPVEGEKDTLGRFDPTDRAIIVAPGMDPRQQLAVFFHETTHLALWDSGVSQVLQKEVEEAVCDAVSVWLTQAVLTGSLTLRTRK